MKEKKTHFKEENIGENILDNNDLGNVLNKTQAQASKAKINKWNYITAK